MQLCSPSTRRMHCARSYCSPHPQSPCFVIGRKRVSAGRPYPKATAPTDASCSSQTCTLMIGYKYAHVSTYTEGAPASKRSSGPQHRTQLDNAQKRKMQPQANRKAPMACWQGG